MSDDNTAVNNEYEELEVQRETTSVSSSSEEFSSTYIAVEISLFGKIFIGLMVLSFLAALTLLVFSYTPFGVEFLRNFDFTF
jgi:hypothetical protein